jgi:hypothetical protein
VASDDKAGTVGTPAVRMVFSLWALWDVPRHQHAVRPKPVLGAYSASGLKNNANECNSFHMDVVPAFAHNQALDRR